MLENMKDNFTRFFTRDKNNIITEFIMLCFGYSINKLHTKYNLKNALEDVKGVADEICASNEEDGTDRWLDQNFFRSTSLRLYKFINKSLIQAMVITTCLKLAITTLYKII